MKQKTLIAIFSTVFLIAILFLIAIGQNRFEPGSARPLAHAPAQTLQALVDEAAQTALEKFKDKGLKEENLSITLIDLHDSQRQAKASFRGNERIYPASVVKLFYLVAAHRWLEDKKIEDTPELRRALRDMIVDSSNEATQYIVDVLTHTTGGYELPPKEMEEWQQQRNAVNRYFTGLGFTNINVNQKTFCEDAYGREKVSRGPSGENRNKLTTEATARLLSEIVTRKAVTPERSAQMIELLKRDYSGTSKDMALPASRFRELKACGCGRRPAGPARRGTMRPISNCQTAGSLFWLRLLLTMQTSGRSFRPLRGW